MVGAFDFVVAAVVLTPLSMFVYDRRARILESCDRLLRRFNDLPLGVRRLIGAAGCFFIAYWCIWGLLYPDPNPDPVKLLYRFIAAPVAFGGGTGCLRGRFVFDVTAGIVAVVMMTLTALITAQIANHF